MVSKMDKALELLRAGPCTASQLACRLYGTYDTYTAQSVWVWVYRLRVKRGFNIEARRKGMPDHEVMYTLLDPQESREEVRA